MGRSEKAQKEAFVSNLPGGSVSEIVQVALVLPASVFLWSVLQSRWRYFQPYTVPAFFTDWLLNCCCILCATTIYSSAPLTLNALLVIPGVAIILTTSKRPASSKPKPGPGKHASAAPDPLPQKPFVTNYRGAMMVITCVAILAVDFHVFPRRFAKVETWGTSLMDMGVGSFVFSSGIVSARSVLKARLADSKRSVAGDLAGSVKHSVPLLALGLVRLYSVKGLDYAEHVTEYGVHWNFFFTLGLLPPFVALFQSLFALVPSFSIQALVLASFYEIALQSTGLTAYIIEAPRNDLIAQNREGIFSFLGYLAIFLAGQGTGTFVLPREHQGEGKASRSYFSVDSILGRLALWSVAWTSMYMITTELPVFDLRVSRRLANLPYVLWVCAFNCAQVAACCAVETYLFPGLHSGAEKDAATESRRCKEASSTVLRAFNRNGLAVFLLANLLTGLVNMSIPTLEMNQLQSMAILTGYMGALGTVAVLLDHKNISLKI